MSDLNTITAVGSLVRDPELRYTPGGTAVANFTVGGQERQTKADGQPIDVPFYVGATAFGALAEKVAEHFHAGDVVVLDGALDYSEWTNPEGAKRSRVTVKAVKVFKAGTATSEQLVTDSSGGVRLKGGRNEVKLIGRLTADAEQRQTTGDPLTTARVAVGESWKDRQGDWQEKTHYVGLTAWRTPAKKLANAKKGDVVFLTGALASESWADRDGVKQTRTVLAVRDATVAPKELQPGYDPDRAAKPKATPAPAAAPQAAAQPGDDEFPPVDDLPF